jgi:hypothetical protein
MTNSKDEEMIKFLDKDSKRKYYVYRLIDPRTYETFYVGKGCGNRVFQHAKNVKTLLQNAKDNEISSLKTQQIEQILSSGKEVLSVIHRHGLTEDEAFEVEAALIDAYSNLTNIQSGHDNDRGLITTKDLLDYINAKEYIEPAEEYIIIKTTPQVININGSLYEATRKAWSANLERASKYKYVLSVVSGIVREVYEVDANGWYQESENRIAFKGKKAMASNPLRQLIGKRIPENYRKKGASNPFIYKQ